MAAPHENTFTLRVCKEKEGPDTTGVRLACPPADLLNRGELHFSLRRQHKTTQLSCETETVSFAGERTDDERAPCRYLIGLYDPKKRRLELADAGAPYALRSSVKAGIKANPSVQTFLGQKLTAAEARAELVEAFGSKKAKAARKKALGPNVAGESTETAGKIKAELRAASSTLAPDAVAMVAAGEDEAQPNPLAPRCNVAATSAEDIYSISDDDELIALPYKILLEACRTTTPRDDLPLFVRNLLPAIRAAPKKVQHQLARVGAYIALLCRVLRLPRRSRGLAKVAEKLECSEPLAGLIMDKYSQPSKESDGTVSYNRPQQMVDKTLLALGTLCLIASNLDCGLDDLAHDITLPVSALANYFRELGAVVTKSGGKFKRKSTDADPDESTLGGTRARLSLPLRFPREKRLKKSKV